MKIINESISMQNNVQTYLKSTCAFQKLKCREKLIKFNFQEIIHLSILKKIN